MSTDEDRRNTHEQLTVLEQRVCEKWAAVAAARFPQEFDLSSWSEVFNHTDFPVGTPLPPDVPQFPREQWASYPTKRRLALMMCESLLDRDEELSDEQWMLVSMTMQYGGKTRLV